MADDEKKVQQGQEQQPDPKDQQDEQKQQEQQDQKPDDQQTPPDDKGERDIDELDPEELEAEAQKISGDESGEKEPDEAKEPGEDDGQQDDWQKRFKDTQVAYTKSQQELKRVKEEKERLEKDLAAKEFDGFEYLSEEDQAELKEDDPDAYIRYKDREKRYNQLQQEKEQIEIREIQNGMKNASLDFFGNMMGLDMNSEANREDNEKKVIEALKDPESREFKVAMKLDDHLMRNVIPVKSKKVKDRDGNEHLLTYFSQDQLQMAYNYLFKDEILNNATKSGRNEAIDAIDRASNGGSKLQKASQDKSDSSRPKKLEDYSQAEIDSMDEDQLNQLIKQNDIAI